MSAVGDGFSDVDLRQGFWAELWSRNVAQGILLFALAFGLFGGAVMDAHVAIHGWKQTILRGLNAIFGVTKRSRRTNGLLIGTMLGVSGALMSFVHSAIGRRT